MRIICVSHTPTHKDKFWEIFTFKITYCIGVTLRENNLHVLLLFNYFHGFLTFDNPSCVFL